MSIDRPNSGGTKEKHKTNSLFRRMSRHKTNLKLAQNKDVRAASKVQHAATVERTIHLPRNRTPVCIIVPHRSLQPSLRSIASLMCLSTSLADRSKSHCNLHHSYNRVSFMVQ